MCDRHCQLFSLGDSWLLLKDSSDVEGSQCAAVYREVRLNQMCVNEGGSRSGS